MKNILKKEEKYIEVELGVLIFQENESYLAFCPALNLSTYGDSISDVKEAFEDVLKCYLEDSEKTGTLESDLRSHGWKMQINMGIAQPPKEVDLNIPAGVLRQQFNEPFRIPMPVC